MNNVPYRPGPAPALCYFVLKFAPIQSIFKTKFCPILGLFLFLCEVKNILHRSSPALVLGYFVLKFVPVQYIFRAKLCPSLGLFFIFLRGEKCSVLPPSCANLGLGHCYPPSTWLTLSQRAMASKKGSEVLMAYFVTKSNGFEKGSEILG